MKLMKCDECGGKIANKKVEFKLYGESLGYFPAEVCTKCGEQVFSEETSDKIDEIAKEKGLWGLGVDTKVIKVGSSTAILINKRIADFLGLKKGKTVHVRPEDKNKISIEL